jgi:hypothetical protein
LLSQEAPWRGPRGGLLSPGNPKDKVFGDSEGHREEGTEDGCVHSPRTLRDGGLRGQIYLCTGNSER